MNDNIDPGRRFHGAAIGLNPPPPFDVTPDRAMTDAERLSRMAQRADAIIGGETVDHMRSTHDVDCQTLTLFVRQDGDVHRFHLVAFTVNGGIAMTFDGDLTALAVQLIAELDAIRREEER